MLSIKNLISDVMEVIAEVGESIVVFFGTDTETNEEVSAKRNPRKSEDKPRKPYDTSVITVEQYTFILDEWDRFTSNKDKLPFKVFVIEMNNALKLNKSETFYRKIVKGQTTMADIIARNVRTNERV
jgi:hypothetical protein